MGGWRLGRLGRLVDPKCEVHAWWKGEHCASHVVDCHVGDAGAQRGHHRGLLLASLTCLSRLWALLACLLLACLLLPTLLSPLRLGLGLHLSLDLGLCGLLCSLGCLCCDMLQREKGD